MKVPYGQLTFDVEGNDTDESIYFSRVAHWPQGPSGVTIGRGYDLSQRSNPEFDLKEAGTSEPLYSWLIGAKGLQGQPARNYLNSANQNIKKLRITRKQHHLLFISAYEFMKSEVIRISNTPVNTMEYSPLNWEAIDSKIQDITVDLIYRGDYTINSRTLVQQYIVDNNITALRNVISDRSNWPNVPDDRFNKRAEYLR